MKISSYLYLTKDDSDAHTFFQDISEGTLYLYIKVLILDTRDSLDYPHNIISYETSINTKKQKMLGTPAFCLDINHYRARFGLGVGQL